MTGGVTPTEKLYVVQVRLAASLATVEILELIEVLADCPEQALARLGHGLVDRWRSLVKAVEEEWTADHVVHLPAEAPEDGFASAVAGLLLADLLRHPKVSA